MATHDHNVESLDDFVARPAEYRARLHKSGSPIVLTVDGKPDVVVQDAAAYQRLVKLLDEMERRETIAAVLRGKADADAGRVLPFDEAMKQIAAKFGLSLPQS